MRLVERAETFERRDLGCPERPTGVTQERVGLAVDQHGAGAALREPAAEFGAVELEIVAQHVEQRRVRLGRHRAAHAIDFQIDGHAARLPKYRRLPRLFRLVLFCAPQGVVEAPIARPGRGAGSTRP